MTGCFVRGCKNRSENGFYLASVPTNFNKKRIWLEKIGRQDEYHFKRPRICEKHFETDQWEPKRDGKKILKKTAIPTLFLDSTPTPKEQDTEILLSEAKLDYKTKYESLLEQHIKLQNNNKKLSKLLYQAKRKICLLKNNIKKVLTKDQIQTLTSKKRKFSKCSNKTLEKSLRLRFSCGQTGYNDLRKMGLPYPSIRTLNFHLRHLNFRSGILEDVFKLLKIKLSNSNTKFETDCMLTLDEMELKKSLDFCIATNSFTGCVTLPNHKKTLASKALVFMLGGITTRWKQAVAYYFTSDSTNGSVLANILIQIVEHAFNIGLNVVSVTSDMGACNQAMWRSLGIVAGKHSRLINFIKNPLKNEEKVYFLADVPHLFKNIKSCLINNKRLEIPIDLKQKYNLPNQFVDVKYIESFCNEQGDMDLKFAPKLSHEQFDTDHFNKMKVSNSYNVLNHNVSCGMKYIAEETQDNCSLTTAWFIDHIYKWFKLMTSRTTTLAISKFNLKKYKETIEFLQEIIHLFQNLIIISKNNEKSSWKPVQTGVILTTTSILNLQNVLLNEKHYTFVLTSRFSQDCLENLFSQIRARQPVPSCLQFQQLIKLISVAQFLNTGRTGSYSSDNRQNLSGFLDIPKNKKNCGQDEKALDLPQDWNNTKRDISLRQQNILYNSAGYIFRSVMKTLKCSKCRLAVGSKNFVQASYTRLVYLKEFKPSTLYYVNKNIFPIFILIEQTFLNLSKVLNFTDCNNINVFTLVKNEITNDPIFKSIPFPNCHNIIIKLIDRFIRYRFKIHTATVKRKINKRSKNCSSSKSIAMRQVVAQYKSSKRTNKKETNTPSPSLSCPFS